MNKQTNVYPTWNYPKEDPSWKEQIIKEFKLHPVTAQVIVSKGFKDIDQIHHYLYDKLPDLHSPFLLQQMEVAVSRVIQAIDQQEPILIYGDNDVDGMTGTSLLTEYLQCLGANVHFYISNRKVARDHLIVETLDFAEQQHCKLLITVDCGITAASEIEKVSAQGIDVIITDHHEPTGKMPAAFATLNPKLKGNLYPNTELTGVGVAFKLAHAITNTLIEQGKISRKKIDLKRFLDLVALGSISDMAPLLGENRILVKYGIKQLKKGKRIGLAKLISVSDLNVNDISSFTIASKISPRLNSLGRIDDPKKGVDLLLIRNNQQAEKLAQELDLTNIERQKIDRTMSLDVEQTINADLNILQNKAICLSSDKWHPGLIAISSTRISKQFNRPTAIIAIENGIGKGSLRSVKKFPLLPALESMSDLLINFGGHDAAAGLSVKEENISEFKKRFLQAANEKLSDLDVATQLNIDAHVKFDEITFDLIDSMQLLEPYGNENQQPVFYCKTKQAWPPKIVGNNHLKLYLQQKERMLEGIAFGKGAMSPFLRKKELLLEIAFTPQINYYQGSSIQLLIKDFRIVPSNYTQIT